MKTFWNVLKNDYLRTIPRIMTVTVITIVTLTTMVLAVYITGLQQVKGHVALITKNSEVLLVTSKHLDITVLEEKPPRSDLVRQKFDAFVTIDQAGNYQIETLRSKDFKNMLFMLLQNPNMDIKDISPQRGVGVNILGFMMMFFLMISFSNLFGFADDKEQGQLRRIMAAPTSLGWYLAAHCIYCVTLLLPEYILLIIIKLSGFNIGFSLLEYAGLMTVLALFGIAVALLLNTLINKPDNATMLGNSIMILTSVLSGSFYSFSKNNVLLGHILKLLPQKQLMDFAQYMENGTQWSHSGSIIYVIAFSVALFVLSCALLSQKYVKKV